MCEYRNEGIASYSRTFGEPGRKRSMLPVVVQKRFHQNVRGKDNNNYVLGIDCATAEEFRRIFSRVVPPLRVPRRTLFCA